MEKLANLQNTTSVSTVEKILTDILIDISTKFTFPELNQNNLRESVWDSLFKILNNQEFWSVHDKCLSAVRIVSRDKTDLSCLITKDRLNTLLRLAELLDTSEKSKSETPVEALKCLCNIVFNDSQSVKLICGRTIIDKALYRVTCNATEVDYQLFCMKFLFLLTALDEENRMILYNDCKGLVILGPYLSKLSGAKELSDNENKLIGETLKTIFNMFMSQRHEISKPEDEGAIKELVMCLRDMLVRDDISSQVECDVVNLLTVLPRNTLVALILPGIDLRTDICVGHASMRALDVVVSYLDRMLDDVEKKKKSPQEYLSPALVALINMSKAHRVLRKYLRNVVLPHLKDVHTRPEEGSTLRNKLCRLLTSPVTSVSDLVADWLFILCKESVGRMVKYTGYGNAAGLFARRGLMGDSIAYSSDSEGSDTEEYAKYKHEINPVVGCRTSPHPDPLQGMTDEQKEALAMELVNSIDKLQRGGVVQPCRVGEDGKPSPIEHVLQLQEVDKRREQYRAIKTDSDDSD